MKDPRDVLISVQSGLDIPTEATALEPIVTLSGMREAAIDFHEGLLAFSDTEVSVGVRDGAIAIFGNALRIVLMKRSRIVIRGEIDGVRMERGVPG
ncbi:MAG: hypothetical protein IJT18_06870 [Oscillospiraceae bacterium]|nr:hypothetical protein [Oscillospiraceae bacterium]